MELKLIGAICIIFACGGIGIWLSVSYNTEIKYLRQMITVIERMEWELDFHLCPLPELCERIKSCCEDGLKDVLENLSKELSCQISPDVYHCMCAALGSVTCIPPKTVETLKLLGGVLGKYDLEGQRKGLISVRRECTRKLDSMEKDKDNHIRNYKTLGLCAGAAIIIILI